MYSDGSGNIDRALAFDYLCMGIGEYPIDENSMLGMQGYKAVVVKPGYYNYFDNVDSNNVTYGMIDVGFYENHYWENRKYRDEFEAKWQGKPMSKEEMQDLLALEQRCIKENIKLKFNTIAEMKEFFNKYTLRTNGGKSMMWGFKTHITDTSIRIKEG